MHCEERLTPRILRDQESIYDLMGHSAFVQHLDQQVRHVAQTNFTVVVQGETGTGKELVSRMLHAQSDRAEARFIPIDCGAIPESLMESELFGHVKGAFTGAACRQAGYFELAHGGTLFLDEITNLSPQAQKKLLRVLQEQEIFPLGGHTSVRTDVRLLVATNVVLAEEVRAGRFRADLFHRLNEFTISLMPLRQRREDILFLAERFQREANQELGKQSQSFSDEACAYVLEYDWPGNVRELRNTVRRAVLLSSRTIERKHLRQALSSCPMAMPIPYGVLLHKLQQGNSLHDVVDEVVAHLEKTFIQCALAETGGNKSQAAARLHIGYKALYRKLHTYGLHG